MIFGSDENKIGPDYPETGKHPLNHRRRELIKPDRHHDYKHLCSSSLAITDQLFGDEDTVRPGGLFLAWRFHDRQTNPPSQRKTAWKVKVNNKSLDHVSNIDVKVSKTLHVPNDYIAGRLKHFSSQWQNITFDHFILDSVTQYKIESAAGFTQQEAVGREIGFSLQEQFKTKLTTC